MRTGLVLWTSGSKAGPLHNVGKTKVSDPLFLTLCPQVYETKEGKVYFQNTQPADSFCLPLLSLPPHCPQHTFGGPRGELPGWTAFNSGFSERRTEPFRPPLVLYCHPVVEVGITPTPFPSSEPPKSLWADGERTGRPNT